MLRTNWNDDGTVRYGHGLPRGWLLSAVVIFAGVKQLFPERSLFLPGRWRRLLSSGRVDDECCNGLHGGCAYCTRPANQPLPLLFLLFYGFLSFLILLLPLLMSSAYVSLLLILNYLEGFGLNGGGSIGKVRQRVSIRRDVQQFRRRRRRLGPWDLGEWLKRLERGRTERRSPSARCGLSKRLRHGHDDRVDRLNGRMRLARSPMVTLRRMAGVLWVPRSPPILRIGGGCDYFSWNDGRVDRRRYIPVRDVKASVVRRYRHRGAPLTIGKSLVSRCIVWQADRTVCVVRDSEVKMRMENEN